MHQGKIGIKLASVHVLGLRLFRGKPNIISRDGLETEVVQLKPDSQSKGCCSTFPRIQQAFPGIRTRKKSNNMNPASEGREDYCFWCFPEWKARHPRTFKGKQEMEKIEEAYNGRFILCKNLQLSQPKNQLRQEIKSSYSKSQSLILRYRKQFKKILRVQIKITPFKSTF